MQLSFIYRPPQSTLFKLSLFTLQFRFYGAAHHLVYTISAKSGLQAFVSNSQKLLANNSVQISAQCSEHMLQWAESLVSLSVALVPCGDEGATSQLCQEVKRGILNDNMYALAQLDAFGKLPANLMGLTKISMGDFDECLGVSSPTHRDYKTHYCWAHINVQFGDVGKLDTPIQPEDMRCGSGLADVKWSVCMPQSCSEEVSILLIISILLLLGFLGIIAVIVVYATLTEHSLDTADQYSEGKKKEASKWRKYLLCFSLISNGEQIMHIPKSRNMIVGTECIRVITLTWVVGFHMTHFYAEADNVIEMGFDMKKRYFNAWMTAFFSVDSFFLLSGVMLAYSFLGKNSKKSIKSPYMWLMFYVHRYIRLSAPYFAFIAFYTVISPRLDVGGHEFDDNLNDARNCPRVWWTNVLYINNLIAQSERCIGIAWYLASDMQMYIVSPLLLVPFILSPALGLLVLLAACAISIAVTYVTIILNDLPASLLLPIAKGNDDKTVEFMVKVYEPFYIRITPYLVGIFIGQMLLITRTKRPNLNPLASGALWVAAVVIAFTVILVPYDYQNGGYWTPLERASYYSFSRLGWALSVGWVVFAVNRGYGGLVTRFMSLKFWIPLGRLTYCSYLCHMLVANYVFRLGTASIHYDGLWDMYVHGIIPVLFLTFLFALAMSLFFEMPAARIEAMFFSRNAVEQKKNRKTSNEPPAYIKF
ncbi:hypothetical protein Q1695_007737 [Nippostrongylus brasiliensis]|nr:hypothetical protein Q1695_007737 [Nippostrongylus brasiliensis]